MSSIYLEYFGNEPNIKVDSRDMETKFGDG